MNEKIKVEVLGISFSNNNGHNIPYIVILGRSEDKVKIPIIIGASEAQSIAVAIEKVPAPRPLSHDIFVTAIKEFGIKIKEIFIYEYNEGVFSAKISLENSDNIKEIECRPSDGIAIALRNNTPIYTTKKIFDDAGVLLDEKKSSGRQKQDKKPIEELSEKELKKRLDKAIAEENYELAAILNKKLKALEED